MFFEIVNDLVTAVRGVVEPPVSLTLLALMSAVALIQGLTMNSLFALWGKAGQGLIFLALSWFAIMGLASSARFSVDHWNELGITAWNTLLAQSIEDMLGLYLVLAILILAVWGVKALVNR
ncbi:hypothetical protein PB2503_12819 [Parvularcula bermudensis HTCC2503]|uniref:Uncharacterized protein n=1 Tax=Parvularcula bermudensis (strain ATCC BAA-594 / HTCC2503 / KCTC 12087) TaxID=314260 RepID=E0TG30_PARBH|nr:hypothetical protein [Parvularcula bermudensis]ADM10601.1 hypothetical protein PB2503_12819 [Parvularcula bermudensis HTCC2503]